MQYRLIVIDSSTKMDIFCESLMWRMLGHLYSSTLNYFDPKDPNLFQTQSSVAVRYLLDLIYQLIFDCLSGLLCHI